MVAHPESATAVNSDALWCGRCGGRFDPSAPHVDCDLQLALEPPRYCRSCGRRMKVQVDPFGWAAICSVHGSYSS